MLTQLLKTLRLTSPITLPPLYWLLSIHRLFIDHVFLTTMKKKGEDCIQGGLASDSLSPALSSDPMIDLLEGWTFAKSSESGLTCLQKVIFEHCPRLYAKENFLGY